jgi:hypothetical protein
MFVEPPRRTLGSVPGACPGSSSTAPPAPSLEADSGCPDPTHFAGPKAIEDFPAVMYSSTSMRCRDRPAAAPTTTLTAGSTFSFVFTPENALAPAQCTGCNHAGDCFLYLAYSSANAPADWIKIAQLPGCAHMAQSPDGISPPIATQTFTIPVPASLPACAHCVLRFEWVGVQDAGE